MSIEATLIAPDQLAALQAAEPVVAIDTRDADTFAAGHVPGAVNLREVFTYLATSTPAGLMELKATFAEALGKAGLSGKETAVFYEDAMNSGYGQSCRGYYLLTWLGYPKIKVLNGGFSAWMTTVLWDVRDLDWLLSWRQILALRSEAGGCAPPRRLQQRPVRWEAKDGERMP